MEKATKSTVRYFVEQAKNQIMYFLREDPDSHNWEGLLNGDKEAFVSLYNSYFNLLYEYGMRLCRNTDLVKDCIQDLFVKLWSNRDNLAITTAVKPYLLASLRNTMLNKMEKEKHTKDREYKAGYDTAFNLNYSISMDSHMIRHEEERYKTSIVANALEKLTPRQRECIYLRFYSRLEYTEIAGLMNISLKATYKISGRAICCLRKYLKEATVYFVALLTYLSLFF